MGEPAIPSPPQQTVWETGRHQGSSQALVFPSRHGLGFSISKIESDSPCLLENRVGTKVRPNRVKGKSTLTGPALSLQ